VEKMQVELKMARKLEKSQFQRIKFIENERMFSSVCLRLSKTHSHSRLIVGSKDSIQFYRTRRLFQAVVRDLAATFGVELNFIFLKGSF
jgi:hypothetical protein